MTRWTGRAVGRCRGWCGFGATFADAAAEYLRYIEHDRGRKPSTLRGYGVRRRVCVTAAPRVVGLVPALMAMLYFPATSRLNRLAGMLMACRARAW